ncbi:choline-binding transcriptional repressor BetI [Roseisalinus antarcticus]|uniref:HTH-type transcriptional regulator BetI n=1 Tax=Roseisalinus antarcticus TaxID=254357 RepID=A0A1Y5SBM6_9RHOB|nr:transcriptional regulator BetI [Roseisalinus antarcticus]SLN35456.1 HTH-type transcriptional regulator BetI [Roseisalinus antarcticus]
MSAEPKRRAQLVEATIAEIGDVGSLNVTVSRIAKRAGMSSALAFHYFGDKEQIFLAAMRYILTVYGAEVRGALVTADGPRQRVEALIRASFSSANFRREAIAAWLNFYVLAQTSEGARRLLRIYRRRLHSNLVHGLRPLAGDVAPGVAQRIAGLIDGLYLRHALDPEGDGQTAAALVFHALDAELRTLR